MSFVYLESSTPYFFVQDDVLVTEFPAILFGCRSLWDGRFPEYMPNILMGSPLASVGGASLTYPFTYVSYAIARHLLVDEYATMDVFGILHIVLGYLATYRLCRYLNILPRHALVAALTFVMSGGILIMGRSWHSCIPIVVWFPLIIQSCLTLLSSRLTYSEVLKASLSIALWYHVGFPIFWVYGMAFFWFIVLWHLLWRQVSVARLLAVLPPFIAGIGLSLPLFLCQYAATKNINRPGGYGRGILDGVLTMFLPCPIAEARHPNGWGSTNLEQAGSMYYIGGVSLVLMLLAALAFLSRPAKDAARQQLWSLSVVIAFGLCLGPDAPFWSIISKLPLLDMINNHPYRLLPFLALFVAICGGRALSALFSRPQKAIEPALAMLFFALFSLSTELTPRTAIWKVKRAAHMAFARQRPGVPLPLQIHGAGIDVDTSMVEREAVIVVNFFWHPQMKAFADGAEVPVRADKWNRMLVKVARGTSTLSIRYVTGWLNKSLGGVVLCILAALITLAVVRRARDEGTAQ